MANAHKKSPYSYSSHEYRLFELVEARGIEPRSEALQQSASTCVVNVFVSRPHAPIDRIMRTLARLKFRHRSPRMSNGYPVMMTFALPHRQEQIERRSVIGDRLALTLAYAAIARGAVLYSSAFELMSFLREPDTSARH